MKAGIILPGATDIPKDCELLIAVGDAAETHEADWWVPGDSEVTPKGSPQVWAPLGSEIKGAVRFGAEADCREHPAAAAVALAAVQGCDAVEFYGDLSGSAGPALNAAMRRGVAVEFEAQDTGAVEDLVAEPEMIDEE